ncbi:Tyrosine-protein phosphatase YwqE [bioreactor metagenome]|uniref:Tyrosine-protein phosphatase YwqE n=1 Tax=bioreactor metagenome TaxID=1076179 RepID=A0A645H716_9ZZZZ
MKGIIPIIAHPERNEEILSEPVILSSMVQRGILAQINSGSITGLYGRKCRNMAMNLIKSGMAHFVASDSHSCGRRSPDLSRAADIVKKKFGSDIMKQLFYENGMAVLENRIFGR